MASFLSNHEISFYNLQFGDELLFPFNIESVLCAESIR